MALAIDIMDWHGLLVAKMKTQQLHYMYYLVLLPVCMKYASWDESQVTNIAQDEAECYICHVTLTKSCICSYKRSGSALSVLLYFTL